MQNINDNMTTAPVEHTVGGKYSLDEEVGFDSFTVGIQTPI